LDLISSIDIHAINQKSSPLRKTFDLPGTTRWQTFWPDFWIQIEYLNFGLIDLRTTFGPFLMLFERPHNKQQASSKLAASE